MIAAMRGLVMFFRLSWKHLVRWLVLILLVPALTACLPRVGEGPASEKEQKVGGVDCLSSSLQIYERFFEGEAEDFEIRGTFQCMDLVLEKFLKFVRGKDRTRFETQELAAFLEQNFLNPAENKKISAGLQLEVMKIKRIFLGG